MLLPLGLATARDSFGDGGGLLIVIDVGSIVVNVVAEALEAAIAWRCGPRHG